MLLMGLFQKGHLVYKIETGVFRAGGKDISLLLCSRYFEINSWHSFSSSFKFV